MDVSAWENSVAAACVVIIFGGVLFGFFKTKTDGWGPFSTSVLLMILVLFLGALAFALGRAQWSDVSGLLLAIAGYAGGLFAKKDA